MNILKTIFNKKNKIVIGALHFKPLIGYPGFTDIEDVLKTAEKDLKALESGGADGIILENNYDTPHKVFVEPETIACITYLANALQKKTKLPIGLSVLWNDYKTALSVSKIIGAKFIRIPVFVDDVITDYGEITHAAHDAINYRKKINAQNIAIFADVQVKHSQMKDKNKTLDTSIKEAIKNQADAIIITGKWTGDSPQIKELEVSKKFIKQIPILIGSGTTPQNIKELSNFANGFIVGTSLKYGSTKKNEINLKDFNQRISKNKVKQLVSAINN